MLVWNEIDLIECLEVLPEKDEDYGTWHRFTVQEHGLTLVLAIEQYDGDIGFYLYRDQIQTPILQFYLYRCPKIRYVKEQFGNRLDYLEFATSACGSSLTSSLDDNLIERGVRLLVKPHVSIQLF